jgi:predicted dehydrogenase
MSHLNRRDFVKNTLAAAASITIAGTKSSGRVLGANETIRVGVAGLNGRGGSHVDAFSSMPGVQVTYLIDPDARTFGRHVKRVQERSGNAPRTVADVRRALTDRNVDVITIATPNHWHALMTMWAVQAGKDVYVEKPASHNVREGRMAVDLARKHNRIVQHGTQSRTEGGWKDVVAVIRSGKLGRLLVARGLCYKRRDNSMGMAPSINRADVPGQLDFNLWTGPAPMRPYHENLVPYRWHWFWDFGNGDIGNQGVHEMDKARWAIAGAALPRSVVCVGGRFGPSDRAETPNTQIAVFDYGPTQLVFEVRGLSTRPYGKLRDGHGVSNVYHLEEGTIYGNVFYPRNSETPAPLPRVETQRRPGNNHFANFIAAVRSRRRDDLNADILEGHYSSALCHLANISYRLGTDVPFNPRTRAFGDNQEAYETLARMEEHLRDNQLKLPDMRYRVGRRLTIDAKAESFVNDAEAGRLLTRDNRTGFAVNNA